MTDVEKLKSSLLEEYAGSIDTSTLLAILSDYDLSDAEQLNTARDTLGILQATVIEDEASGFDASGASHPHDLVDGLEEGGENGSHSGSGPGWTSQTDATSISHDLSSLDLEGADSSPSDRPIPVENTPATSQLDGLNDEEKEAALMGIFPILKPFDVKWCLKKSGGNASKAIDELMNQSFLEENGIRHKGVDAFSESDLPRPRKGKPKRKNLKLRTSDENSSTQSPVSAVQSKWDTSKKDVEFISSKIGMPIHQVSSIYHKSGGSVQATITEIVNAHKALAILADDPMIQVNAYELKQDFPALTTDNLEALLQLTHPSISNARELAQALSSRSTSTQTPIQLQFRHAPLDLDSSTSSAPPTPTKFRSSTPLDPVSANSIAATYANGRNAAFAQASQYYRKSKSNHLMAGAAAYYAQNGRDLAMLAQSADADAADALVASQSSRLELDLHGVSVKNAVRISRERVTGWWAGGGRGSGGVFKIVTGKGLHSAGQARLGPAVGKMLVREGWDVEVGSGQIYVRGVAKKR